MRIGNIDIAVVSDGRLLMDPALMFGPESGEFRSRVQLEDGRVPFSVNCVLIRTGDRTILLDTGAGRDVPTLLDRFGGGCGLLVDSLGALGVAPADIDTVVISHAHGDHIGGATVDAIPTFPEAVYWFSEVEWEHWLQPSVLAERPFVQTKLPPLMDHGQVELAVEEDEVAPGVRLVFAPGHTPGHMCVAITSGQEMVLYTGDLLHHHAQLEHPDWSPMFDMLPRMSAESRAHILDAARRQNAVLITAHLPTPGIARPAADGWSTA